MLIDSASGPIDWSQYRDETAAELRALVEAKVAGRPPAEAADAPTAVLSLLDALKQSVAAVGVQNVSRQSVTALNNQTTEQPAAPRKRQRKQRRTA
jgi:non-homologous end joining protein Ku